MSKIADYVVRELVAGEITLQDAKILLEPHVEADKDASIVLDDVESMLEKLPNNEAV